MEYSQTTKHITTHKRQVRLFSFVIAVASDCVVERHAWCLPSFNALVLRANAASLTCLPFGPQLYAPTTKDSYAPPLASLPVWLRTFRKTIWALRFMDKTYGFRKKHCCPRCAKLTQIDISSFQNYLSRLRSTSQRSEVSFVSADAYGISTSGQFRYYVPSQVPIRNNKCRWNLRN